jgi:hypothetical protein
MADERVVWRLFGAVLFASGLLAVPIASLAAAQDRPGPSFEVTAGWVGFADDGMSARPSSAARPGGIYFLESVLDPRSST